MRGVMILTPATLLSKVIGLFYKIPLLHIVGVEGMAYFLSAYHVYSLLFVFSAAGLPSALALLVSRRVAMEGTGAVLRLFSVSLGVFLLIASAGTAALFFFASDIAAGLSMPESALSLMAIAPALLLSVFTGAVRGVFQGHHDMLPTAVSEVIEAVGKAEKVEPTEEEIEKAIEEQARNMGQDLEKFRENLTDQQREYLKENAVIRKTLDLMIQDAKIVEKKDEPETKPVEEEKTEEEKPARKTSRKKKTEEEAKTEEKTAEGAAE